MELDGILNDIYDPVTHSLRFSAPGSYVPLPASIAVGQYPKYAGGGTWVGEVPTADAAAAIATAVSDHAALQNVHVPATYKVAAMYSPGGGNRIKVIHESDARTGNLPGDIFVVVADGVNI